MRTLRLTAGRRARRGMALAVTMLLLLAVMVIGLLGMINTPGGSHNGLMTNTTGALQMSNRRLQTATAFNMADAGLHYTLQWLSTLPAPPSITAASGPKFQWGSATYNADGTAAGSVTTVTPDPHNPGNTFSVTLYPDATNAGQPQKCFLVEATGTCGTTSQVIQAYIQVSSLSKWLVLVNQWPNGNYWVSGLSTFDGPVHDNNANSGGNNPGTGLNENVVWDGNATTPMWSYTGSDAYSVSGNVNWYNGTGGGLSSGAPQTAAQWSTVLAGGQQTFTAGAPSVQFPSSSLLQQYAALGQTMPTGATAPPAGSPTTQTSTGVTVTPGGGIYIHCKNSQNDTQGTPPTPNNDVQQMTLSTDGSGNQVISILQNDDNGNPMTTTLTLNVAANQTQVTVNSLVPNGNSGTYRSSVTNSSVSGLGNGVVYCDGNIGSQGTAPGNPMAGTPKSGGLDGTVANNAYSNGTETHVSSLNITTAANKNVNIDGNLVYATARQRNASGGYVPESQDANFLKNAGTIGLVSDNIMITTKDANGNPLNTVETDGVFLAYTLFDVDQLLSRPPGDWENMGGYLSSNMGYFGEFGGNNQLVHGMNNSFNYDARMRDTPPPFFPTNGAQYVVVSWRRVAGTLE